MEGAPAQAGFRRPWHRLVWRVLESLNGEFLASTRYYFQVLLPGATSRCYFGGGTRIALELGEFRESVDVDFLCSDRDGYRTPRNTIGHNTLGEIFSGDYDLIREVRADLYGIRTFLRVDERPVKFEIISEGRIPLTGATVVPFPVEVLDRTSCIAEKLLAHADRGRDESTHARDLIDLAVMVGGWSDEHVRAAMVLAESAYGATVRRELAAGLSRFDDEAHRQRCVDALSITDTHALERGLRSLRRP